MVTKHVGKMALSLAVVAAFMSLAGQPVSAQSRVNTDKVSRNNGAGFWENSRASRNIQHARDYSRSIQQYSTQVLTLNPVVTQAESQMLGQQIQGIQREMSVVREQNASNPKVVEQVKGIETKLQQATSTQKMLHEECCKDSPDGKVCGDMAAKIASTLDQVAKDHAKLLQVMGQQDAAYNHEHNEIKPPVKAGQ